MSHITDFEVRHTSLKKPTVKIEVDDSGPFAGIALETSIPADPDGYYIFPLYKDSSIGPDNWDSVLGPFNTEDDAIKHGESLGLRYQK